MQATRSYSSTIATRLAAKCVPAPNGCIEFTGCRNQFGYGRISRGVRGEGSENAHRVAWMLANGPVPDGLWVLHHCDNPPCCNPDHLFLGDVAANVQDMINKGRGAGHRPAGEVHPDAKLNDEQVVYLRRLAPLVGNYAELGRMFGISKQHARALVLRTKRAA